MKFFICLAIILPSFFAISKTALSADNIKSPIVVELYTSQSCSSCPPADKVLGELAQNKNIIALGYHVTYWNHLHWVDTLSMEKSTELQRQANWSKNSNRVYTPQIIVNGEQDFVGSKRSKIFSYIDKSSRAIRPITINKIDAGLKLEIPKLPNLYQKLSIMVVGFDLEHKQEIKRGENRGLTVSYTNPVNYIDYPNNWDGKSGEFLVDLDKESKAYAVIIREGKAGDIVAAGQIKL